MQLLFLPLAGLGSIVLPLISATPSGQFSSCFAWSEIWYWPRLRTERKGNAALLVGFHLTSCLQLLSKIYLLWGISDSCKFWGSQEMRARSGGIWVFLLAPRSRRSSAFAVLLITFLLPFDMYGVIPHLLLSSLPIFMTLTFCCYFVLIPSLPPSLPSFLSSFLLSFLLETKFYDVALTGLECIT